MPIFIGPSHGLCKPLHLSSQFVATDLLSSENDITGVIEPTFSTEDESFGEIQTIDLKPNGRNIEVTNDNKKEYIEFVPRLCPSSGNDP